MNKCFYTFILILLCSKLFAQLTYFRNIDRADGLPQDFVYTLSNGAKGYLWAGTGQGFSKFSGTNTYGTAQEGLPELTASASLYSSDSTLWLGYFDGSFAQLESDSDSAKVYSNIFTEKISAIIESGYGAIFIIGQRGTIGRYFKDTFTILPPPKRNLIIYDAIHISETAFYLASEKGLLAVDFTANSYNYQIKDSTAYQTLCKNDDYLFAGGVEGLVVFDIYTNTKVFAYQSDLAINDLVVDQRNQLWAATNGNGLLRFDKYDTLVDPVIFNSEDGLASAYVLCLGFDRENNLWAGTAGHGMSMFLGDDFSYEHQELNSKGLNTVLAAVDSSLWVGTDQGLYQIAGKNKRLFFANEPITALYEDTQGNIWVGINKLGLRVLNKNEAAFTIPEFIGNLPDIRFINHITADKKGNIWIATRLQGLLRVNYSDKNVEQYNTANLLPHNNIHQVLCATDSKVWVASSDQGVGYLQNDAFIKITSNNQLNKFEVNCLLEAYDSSVWIGSDGGGLFKYKKDSIHFYGLKDGLLSTYINTLSTNAVGDLWIGSINGLNVLIRENKGFIRFNNQLPAWNTFFLRKNAFASRDNKSWFITDYGLLAYNSSKHNPNKVKPLVTLANLEIDGASIALGKPLILPYGDYRLKFEFEAIAFKYNVNPQFRYQLSGFEKDWSEYAFRNVAEYPRLSSGNYHLQLQSKDASNNYSNISQVLNVSIAKPFWQQIWFYLLVIVSTFSVGYGIHRYRLRRLQKANKNLTIKVAEKTQALANEKEKLEEAYKKLLELESFKESLNSMIVHDLKNPLNLVITLSEHNSPIHEAGRQMLNMVLNILDVNRFEEAKVALHLQDIKLITLLNRAIEQVWVVMKQKHIHIENKLNEGLYVEADPEIFVRIMVNLLSNAAKYSPAGSKVVVSAKRNKTRVEISVKDNGYGIPKEELPFIFDKFRQADNHAEATVRSSGLGLTFCKLAVEAHGGEIKVKSTEGEGSVFTFSVMGKETVGVNIEEKYEATFDEVILSKEDLKVLTPYLVQFQNLEVYDTSANIELISSLPENNAHIAKWKKALLNAVMAFHEQRYHELLAQLTE